MAAVATHAEKLRLMGRRPSATELRRQVASLQSTNSELLAFLATLPPETLKQAPPSVRTLVPFGAAVENARKAKRPHTVLPEISRPPQGLSSSSSPPADSPTDPSLALASLLSKPLPDPVQRRVATDEQHEGDDIADPRCACTTLLAAA